MGSPISFEGYEKVAYLTTWAKKSKRGVKGIENAFMYWNDQEQGGLLTRKVANRLAAFIRKSLIDQEFFSGREKVLNKDWLKRRYKLGAKTDKVGIGVTGALLRGIDYWPSGRGGYTVGIHKGEYTPDQVYDPELKRMVSYGSMTSTRGIAGMLEAYRPWFGPAFERYSKEHFPRDIHDTIGRSLRAAANQFPEEVQAPEFADPDDYLSSASTEGWEGEIQYEAELSGVGAGRRSEFGKQPSFDKLKEKTIGGTRVKYYEETAAGRSGGAIEHSFGDTVESIDHHITHYFDETENAWKSVT